MEGDTRSANITLLSNQLSNLLSQLAIIHTFASFLNLDIKKDQNDMPSPTHIRKMQNHFGHACFTSNSQTLLIFNSLLM